MAWILCEFLNHQLLQRYCGGCPVPLAASSIKSSAFDNNGIAIQTSWSLVCLFEGASLFFAVPHSLAYFVHYSNSETGLSRLIQSSSFGSRCVPRCCSRRCSFPSRV